MSNQFYSLSILLCFTPTQPLRFLSRSFASRSWFPPYATIIIIILVVIIIVVVVVIVVVVYIIVRICWPSLISIWFWWYIICQKERRERQLGVSTWPSRVMFTLYGMGRSSRGCSFWACIRFFCRLTIIVVVIVIVAVITFISTVRAVVRGCWCIWIFFVIVVVVIVPLLSTMSCLA
jgi:hypothetical protein